jgi:coenzyme F420-0:L-glutamate ligase/NADPH-dependent F420 reductase
VRVGVVGGTGPFGRALAVRLHTAGHEVVVGSRERERAEAAAAELGVAGATNADAVRAVDLVVLATNADGALDTARSLRAAIRTTPMLSVASELRFTPGGVLPSPEARSLAERLQDEVDAPVLAGLHSLAAATLGHDEAPDEDAFVCGDDAQAKALTLELAAGLVAGRALDAGPLASARALEGMTAVIVNLNKRYRGHAGIRVTGLPVTGEVRVIPLRGIAELREGDDLGAILAHAAARAGGFEPQDVLVVAQKAVSKVEGRVIELVGIEPSPRALELAGGSDARRMEVIVRESREVLRSRPPLVIAETRHGFVCASAGVDSSNAPEPGTLVLLPLDPDASARRLRESVREITKVDVAVIVSDSFGRAWRLGTTDVALGVSGLAPLLDLTGERDAVGYELHATEIAIADEIAGAAELVMGKTRGVPAAIVRGLRIAGDGSGQDLVMPRERDLFR